MLSRGKREQVVFLLIFLPNIDVKSYSITKGLGLFLADYNVHFGVLHQPRQRQLGHVCVSLILTLQEVKILPNPKSERRRSALTLALRQTLTTGGMMILNHIRKQSQDIGMLGHGQPLHQDIGI